MRHIPHLLLYNVAQFAANALRDCRKKRNTIFAGFFSGIKCSIRIFIKHIKRIVPACGNGDAHAQGKRKCTFSKLVRFHFFAKRIASFKNFLWRRNIGSKNTKKNLCKRDSYVKNIILNFKRLCDFFGVYLGARERMIFG